MKKSLQKFFKGYWKTLIGLLIGSIAGLGTYYIKSNWLDKSKLAIEINSISKDISEDYGIALDSEEYPELKILDLYTYKRAIKSTDELREKTVTFLPEELGKMLEMAQEELIEIDNLFEPADTSESDLGYYDYLDFFDRPPLYSKAIAMMASIPGFKGRYDIKPKEVQDFISDKLTNAEKTIQKLNEIVEDEQSLFTIETAVRNEGKTNISIKRLALLRVYIGKGFYIDLKLKVKDFDTGMNTNIPSHGTKLVIFQSEKIGELQEQDQELIGNYWKQRAHGILFTEDVLNNIHSSSSILFSEGVYRKLIYERLSKEASKEKYYDGNQ